MKLSFNDLLNAANEAAADDVFKNVFSNRTIEHFGRLEYDVGEEAIVSDYDITIFDCDIFEKTLKRFGHLIEKMNIQLYRSDDMGRFKIAEDIGRYTSNSLKSIRLAFCSTKMVDKFQRTFTKLENLTISGDLSPSGAIYSAHRPLKKLNEVFPNVRKLSLDYMAISDPSVLDVTFESLSHLQINFLNVPYEATPDVYFNYTQPAMLQLFKRNPLIQRFDLGGCYSMGFVYMAAEHFYHLHELSIEFAPFKEKYDGPKMSFPNLKKLTLRQNGKFFKSATFPELRELFLTCAAKSCTDFPKQNQNLIRLHIEGYNFKNETILQLDERAPNLEDLFIKGNSGIDMKSVIEYVEESLNLKMFRFINKDDDVLKNLTNHFASGWNVARKNSVVTLERME